MGSYTLFTPEQEEELYKYILSVEAKLFGFTAEEVRRIAFQLAERMQIKNRFHEDEGLAGIEWFRGFMRRHKELVLRKPEATSSARANGFNEEAVTLFYNILEALFDKYDYPAQNIYNVDETKISVLPKSMGKIIARRGKKQVGYMTSGDRAETITAEICFSASGNYMPPLLIFPRKKFNAEYLVGKSPDAWGEV